MLHVVLNRQVDKKKKRWEMYAKVGSVIDITQLVVDVTQFSYLTLKFINSRLTYSEELVRAYQGDSLTYFI